MKRSILLLACAAFSMGAYAAVHELERPELDAAALSGASFDQLGANPGMDLGVDLHAHLFMKPGMTLLFHGGFFGPLEAKSWKSRFGSQANEPSVAQSGLGLLVVALYAHPLLTWSPRDAVREQIRQAERFVAGHPEWVIARSAPQAAQAIAQGKRVLVLSLERASWIIETDEDLKEFVDEKGIRIVTFLHLTDDRFGGVAFLEGYHQLATPWRWFIELFKPSYDEAGVKVNAHGLTEKGRIMAQKLIDRGVWIDLSHSSDASQRELMPMLEKAGQPLLYSHGGVRRFTRTERGISDQLLERVRRSGGLVGICPSEDNLNPTKVPEELCRANQGCPRTCGFGLPGFVVQYSAAAAVLGGRNVMIGSDFNGAVPHLPPSCGTGTGLDREGLWNIGQSGELWEAARSLGAPLPARRSDHIVSFLEKWAKVTR